MLYNFLHDWFHHCVIWLLLLFTLVYMKYPMFCFHILQEKDVSVSGWESALFANYMSQYSYYSPETSMLLWLSVEECQKQTAKLFFLRI